MGKIVIWNSEICFGHMLYFMVTVPALLGQKALSDGSSLAGKDIKLMGPKAQGGEGGTFLSSPWWSEGKFTITGLFGLRYWSRWSREKVEGPTLAITTAWNTQAWSTPRKEVRCVIFTNEGSSNRYRPCPSYLSSLCGSWLHHWLKEGVSALAHSLSALVSSCVKWGQWYTCHRLMWEKKQLMWQVSENV